MTSLRELGMDEESVADMSPDQANRMAAVLDLAPDFVAGDAVPLLWHWAFFTPTTPTGGLGEDGHPVLPAGGPTAGLPRRMWAGGRIVAHEPLVLGVPARRRSRLLRAERKDGRSGPLLVVTIEHQIDQDGQRVRSEEQDLVYRTLDRTPPPGPSSTDPPELTPSGWAEPMVVGPVVLFRFSAVTFNSHRIHVDEPYATSVEGYPGLVVHGPLTAVLLCEAATKRRGTAPAAFDFRATAPLFSGVPFHLVGDGGDAPEDLRAVRTDGVVSMTARIT